MRWAAADLTYVIACGVIVVAFAAEKPRTGVAAAAAVAVAVAVAVVDIVLLV